MIITTIVTTPRLYGTFAPNGFLSKGFLPLRKKLRFMMKPHIPKETTKHAETM